MAIYLIRDFLNEDIDSAIGYVESVGFKSSPRLDGAYHKVDGREAQAVDGLEHLVKRVQVNVKKEILEELLKILKPELFQTDSDPKIRPISELRI